MLSLDVVLGYYIVCYIVLKYIKELKNTVLFGIWTWKT